MDEELKNILWDDTEERIRFQIKKCVSHYGLEGAKETIISVYKTAPTISKLFLDEFQRMYGV